MESSDLWVFNTSWCDASVTCLVGHKWFGSDAERPRGPQVVDPWPEVGGGGVSSRAKKNLLYSQNSHNPYLSVDSPGYGFSGVMGWKGWEKNKRSRKLTKIFEKILFSLLQWVCWTRRQTFNAIWASHCWCTCPQWCWLHDWAKIDLDCRLIPENLVMNRSINLVLW